MKIMVRLTQRLRRVRMLRWLAAAWLAFSITWFALGRYRCYRRCRAFAVDYRKDTFRLRGEPVQIMSGAIHYFRVLPELWEDRLRTMQAAGLNTIETYVEWSSHEPEEGQFDFEGQQDVVRFLRIAHSLGFMVILRSGPYICAERDFGGFPYWLLRNGTDIKLRTSDKKYLFYVERFMTKLFEKVEPLLIRNGGPIIMVQVENEYGSYFACDSAYMRYLRDLTRACLGSDVVLFTTDGSSDQMLKCGRVNGTLTTVDFSAGSDPKVGFDLKRRFQKRGPLMNSEMYTGWLDHWGSPKERADATVLGGRIRELLAMNASFNLYMFHGGTNFGFKAGANDNDGFQPQLTSYDYDAPINEAGDATEKFKVVRDAIAEFFPHRVKEIPAPKKKMALGKVAMKRIFGLEVLRELMSGRMVVSSYPQTFEHVGHAYGFMLYDTIVRSEAKQHWTLNLRGVRDRGYIYVDDVFKGIVSRSKNTSDIALEAERGQRLSILVENQGRINYGSSISDRKGIIENVTLDDTVLTGWEMRPIGLSDATWLRDIGALTALHREDGSPRKRSVGVAVYAGNITLPQEGSRYDTFLRLDDFRKGVAFLNGFNLGRYWNLAGPQRTLYVPGVLFRGGFNLLVLLELESAECISPHSCSVNFLSEPNLDEPVHWPL